MIKGVILVFSLIFLAHAQKIEYKNVCTNNFYELTQEQINTLKKAYKLGEAAGYGYVMAALAWHESCAGEVKINLQDPSAGLFHTYLPNVFDRNPHLIRSGLNQNIITQMLIENDEFSARECIAELEMWKRQHGENLKNILKSYNKGNAWQRDPKINEIAEKYYESVSKKMAILQEKLFSNNYIAKSGTNLRPTVETKPQTVLKISEQGIQSISNTKNLAQNQTSKPNILFNQSNKNSSLNIIQPQNNRVLEMPIYTSATKNITPKPQPAIKFESRNSNSQKIALNSKAVENAKLMYE